MLLAQMAQRRLFLKNLSELSRDVFEVSFFEAKAKAMTKTKARPRPPKFSLRCS